MVIAYIGLGSNLGDSRAYLQAACMALDSLPSTRLLARSSDYASAAMGEEYQHHPSYYNAVAKLQTALSAVDLLSALMSIEQQAGRDRRVAYAARVLDLDILLYDTQQIDLPNLQVPHPRMAQRAFVLEPLFEISPELLIPQYGRVADLRWLCLGQAITRC